MDCSPPSSSVHGILQARILEWIVISSSREASQPRDQTCISCIGKQILYHWSIWEAQNINYPLIKEKKKNNEILFLTAQLNHIEGKNLLVSDYFIICRNLQLTW